VNPPRFMSALLSFSIVSITSCRIVPQRTSYNPSGEGFLREPVGVGVVPLSLSVIIAYPVVSQTELVTRNSIQRFIGIANQRAWTNEKA
jgi:hypothetical protein